VRNATNKIIVRHKSFTNTRMWLRYQKCASTSFGSKIYIVLRGKLCSCRDGRCELVVVIGVLTSQGCKDWGVKGTGEGRYAIE